MKKLASIFLTLLMLLSLGLTCPAAEETMEYIINGGFEEWANETAPKNWKVTSSKATNPVIEAVDGAAEGEKALKLASDEGQILVSQAFTVIPGKEYTLSYQVKMIEDLKGANVKFEFYHIDEEGNKNYQGDQGGTFQDVSKGRWTKKTIKFTADAGKKVNNVSVIFRIYGGEYHWDSFSLIGPKIADEPPVPNNNILPAHGDAGNLIQNPGMEAKEGTAGAEGWKPYKNKWEDNAFVSMDKEVKYEGENSVKIETATGGNPWVAQTIAVEPNTTYQLSAWVRQLGLATNARNTRFKVEYYTSMDTSDATYLRQSRTSFDITPTSEKQWQQAEMTFTTIDKTAAVVIYCRLYATVGTVWFDGVELRQVSRVNPIMVNTDQYFYYPDIETGYAEAGLVTKFVEKNRTGSVDFALLAPDKTTVLKEQTGTKFTDDKAYFDYPISLLSKKKTAYYVRATLKDAAGSVVDTAEIDIYCYDRPAKLNEKGEWLEDGKPWQGTIGYHVKETMLDEVLPLGINLVQVGYGFAGTYKTGGKEQLQKELDDLAARNMKGVVCLYAYMKPAAHPDNIENTKALVADFIDHPAVYAYATMDEPFAQIPNPEYYLKESYKTIREIDDIHPVYMLDASPEEFEAGAKLCDIFVNDAYPAKTGTAAPKPAQQAARARRFTERYGKSVVMVQQAFTYVGFTPDNADLRSQWYQTLFEGAHVTGWYEYNGATGIINNEGWQKYLAEFAKEEQALSYELFGRSSTCPVYNRFENAQYGYKSVVRDGELYIMVLNLTQDKDLDIAVSLKSRNGLVTASGEVEELYAVGEGAKPKIENDTLTVSIPFSEVGLFKIRGANIDTALLDDESFADLAGYEWAAEAIEKMYREDVANARGDRAYDPAAPITRGEFASFLVRALDLGMVQHIDEVDTMFTDVPEDAPYYTEVKTGKFYNILRGMGDNSFNPEAPITRQDLMVICARGLHEAMKMGSAAADLSAFSDNALIADYAKSAVAEMIEAGIIKGNADGTINPLGNTTRAEAAVIMQRIAEK